MESAISATRLAGLVGRLDTTPAYAGLAHRLRLLIGEGRIPLGMRLPSERDLSLAVGVSRTTATRAYATLRDAGFASARQGAGTFATIPGGRSRVLDRTLVPGERDDIIDLNCAAGSAPPGLTAAFEAAVDQLPAYFSTSGYYPTGLPALRQALAARFTDRGLPTTADQILITSGALAAVDIIARAFVRRGDPVLIESPCYPNARQALSLAGARLRPVPVEPAGWDLATARSVVWSARAPLAYVIPDFHNPTGNLMSSRQRKEYADALAMRGTVPIVDESMQWLDLSDKPMPRPFASFARDSLTVGSASKAFWGGLRLGWIRASRERIERLTQVRVTHDLGAPVLEQLALTHLLGDPEPVLGPQRLRLREQRDVLRRELATRLPDWGVRKPRGGLILWCELPAGSATDLCLAAETAGVLIAPGPVFSVDGGLDRFVRIPYTQPPERLIQAAEIIARAWHGLDHGRPRSARSTGPGTRVMIA